MRPGESREGRWLRRLAAEGIAPSAEGLDGARLVALARRHRLSALAGSLLAAGGPAPSFAAELVSDWRRAIGEQALAARALEEVAERFRARGVSALTFKGGDVGRRLYGPGERPSNDIDLLVAEDRLDDALAALAEAGFRTDASGFARQRRRWFSAAFRSVPCPRLLIDLHWRLGPSWRARWNEADVAARSEASPGLPAGIRRMADADVAAHLALHAVAFHGASGRWIWWLDIRRLWATSSDAAAAWRARAAEVGGLVAFDAARLRCARLFGPLAGAETLPAPGVRARLAAAHGAFWEDRAGDKLARWPVAALVVDRPLGMVAAIGRALSRPLRG